MDKDNNNKNGERIDSWKRIARFFNRGERTVRRWEREEGLPVHRHQHGGSSSVYAYTDELETWLQSRSGALNSPPPEDRSPAEEFYLKGLGQLGQVKIPAFMKAIEDFDKAIAADPDFASAYARKAETLQLLTVFGAAEPTEVMPMALESISSALSRNPKSAEVNAALGLILTCYSYDWKGAERALKTAIENDANYVAGHQWQAELLASLGRFDEADEAIARAQKLDPASLTVHGSKGYVLCLSRRFDQLIEEMTDLVERDAHFPLAYINLGLGYANSGDMTRAAETFELGVQNSGGYADIIALHAYGLAKSGRGDKAREAAAQYNQARGNRSGGAFLQAIIALGFDEPTLAIERLEAAFAERAWSISMIGQEKILDPLRNEPKFVSLLEKVGLADSTITAQ